jgi:hypothetical protein
LEILIVYLVFSLIRLHDNQKREIKTISFLKQLKEEKTLSMIIKRFKTAQRNNCDFSLMVK